MRVINMISDLMIPLIFVGIITYGLVKRVNVFESFLEGVMDGFQVVVKILPTFLGLVVAVGILRASGALELITMVLSPFSEWVHFPPSLIPIALTKFVSSSAATGLILDLFKVFGPDSLEGRMTSIMIGSTETILYTMSVYFMVIKVKDTRYTLSGAIVSNLAGIAASVVLTYILFGA